MNLPISLFLLYRRDAWVYNNMRTEKGKTFLHDLWRLQQTIPDYQAIHKFQEERGGK